MSGTETGRAAEAIGHVAEPTRQGRPDRGRCRSQDVAPSVREQETWTSFKGTGNERSRWSRIERPISRDPVRDLAAPPATSLYLLHLLSLYLGWNVEIEFPS